MTMTALKAARSWAKAIASFRHLRPSVVRQPAGVDVWRNGQSLDQRLQGDINDAVAKADIAASKDVIHAIDEPHAQRSGSAP